MRKINAIIVFSGALMSGCAGNSILSSDPRCPFTEKGGCQSVKSINRMIDENRYTSEGDYVQQPKPPCPDCVRHKKTMRVYIPELDKPGRPVHGRIETMDVYR